jgi:hypothetical protein
MQHWFSHDFSKVQVHADSRAADSAKAIDAQAYTVGRHIIFGAGRFAPETASGRRLIAHELAHTIQQGESSAIPEQLRIAPKDQPREQEAVTAARAFQAPLAPGAPVQIAMQDDDPQDAGIRDASLPGGLPDSADPVPAPVAPPATPSDPATAPVSGPYCEIDVRATSVGTAPIGKHLFIVATTQDGKQLWFRGGPGKDCTGAWGTHKAIQITTAPYDSSATDWDPDAPSYTVAQGSRACSAIDCLWKETARMRGQCVNYYAPGPNSNTVVATYLRNCGLPVFKPDVWAPGFGDDSL